MNANQHADGRTDLHTGDKSQRILVDGHDRIGMAGEVAFQEFSGVPLDTSLRRGGDGGCDFRVSLNVTVDVKTSSSGKRLLHEQGKPVADIYVLAHWKDGKATLVGWQWGTVLLSVAAVDTGRGVINHCIPVEELLPMSQLRKWIQWPPIELPPG